MFSHHIDFLIALEIIDITFYYLLIYKLLLYNSDKWNKDTKANHFVTAMNFLF